MMINGYDDKDIECNKCGDDDEKRVKAFSELLDAIAHAAEDNQKKAEEEMKLAAESISKVLYVTYSEMLRAGFDKNQALNLTKCLVLGAVANPVLKR